MHHLQIMESLGGDVRWVDRFLAQHGAILYYWVLVAFFLLFPSHAYNFGELVELHASDTYAEFADVSPALPCPALYAAQFSCLCTSVIHCSGYSRVTGIDASVCEELAFVYDIDMCWSVYEILIASLDSQ